MEAPYPTSANFRGGGSIVGTSAAAKGRTTWKPPDEWLGLAFLGERVGPAVVIDQDVYVRMYCVESMASSTSGSSGLSGPMSSILLTTRWP